MFLNVFECSMFLYFFVHPIFFLEKRKGTACDQDSRVWALSDQDLFEGWYVMLHLLVCFFAEGGPLECSMTQNQPRIKSFRLQ